MRRKSLSPHELREIIGNHLSVGGAIHCLELGFASLPHSFHMVSRHLGVGINKMQLVIHSTMLIALCCEIVVSSLHVAPNFSSRRNPLLDQRHQSGCITTRNRYEESTLTILFIATKDPLFRNNMTTIIFSAIKQGLIDLDNSSRSTNLLGIWKEELNCYIPKKLIPVNNSVVGTNI